MGDLFQVVCLNPYFYRESVGVREGSAAKGLQLERSVAAALKKARSPHWRFAPVDTITWDHSCWQNVAS